MMNIDEQLKDLELRTALESAVTNLEIELVVYGKLKDFEALLDADSFVSQEQWQVRVNDASIRVRANYEGDDAWFVRTTKTKDSNGRTVEIESEIFIDEFLQFMSFAESGMIKKRVTFKVDQHVLEVDVFLKPGGGYYDWIKIDIELESVPDETEEQTKERVVELLKNFPDLPFELDNIMIELPSFMEVESKHKDAIRALYDSAFISKPFRELTDTDHIKIK